MITAFYFLMQKNWMIDIDTNNVSLSYTINEINDHHQ